MARTAKEQRRLERERKRKGVIPVQYCTYCGNKMTEDVRANKKYCSRRCHYLHYQKPWAQANPHKVKRARKKYRADPQAAMCNRVKHRAKKQGLAFDLEKSDFVIPEVCPVLGIRLSAEGGTNGKASRSAASVDKIDPQKGYVKGNVRIISNRANVLKRDAEIWELEAVLDDLRRLQCESP